MWFVFVICFLYLSLLWSVGRFLRRYIDPESLAGKLDKLETTNWNGLKINEYQGKLSEQSRSFLENTSIVIEKFVFYKEGDSNFFYLEVFKRHKFIGRAEALR